MAGASEEEAVDGTIEYPLVNPDEMAAEAWAAMARQDSAEALRLWQKLRQDFPERPDGHVWPVQVLWQGGRIDEAATMATAALARFPDNPELLVQNAWIAMARERWDEALQWWAAVRERDPARLDGYVRAARVLWRAGRLDEADAMAAEALERFPGHGEALAECAWVAVARHDWQEARRRWTLVAQSHPDRLDGKIGLIQALRLIGRVDEAEAAATQALARQPDNQDLLAEHVWAAVARDDWPAVAARFDTAQSKKQDAARFEASLGWVEAELRRRGEPADPAADRAARPVAVAPRDQASPADELSTADLMLSFESLGERCDFGAVQRHFGIEPLGLLRFAFTKLDPLLAALGDRFAAVGTVADTGFELYSGETILIMQKYGLVFHTFVYQKEPPTAETREAFRQQQRRRLGFLRDKLIADLEDPQKIYIYATDERVADADVARLFAALRAYGRNSLLYVRPASRRHPEGSVKLLEEGLFAGYFPGLANFVDGAQPPFELWRQLCERTYRLARAGARK